VTKRLRGDQRTAGIPILILSAKGETENRIKGLELGADDHLPKPFSPKSCCCESRRSCGAKARRRRPPTRGRFHWIATRSRSPCDGRRVDLTSTEFKLLSLLIGKAGAIQSREDLLQEVWGYRNTVDTRTVDTHMRRLREKLGDHAACIETVRGEGYRFLPPARTS